MQAGGGVEPTEQQVDALRAALAEWERSALGTARTDRPAAEAAIRAAYRATGLPRPLIVWTGSPFGAMFAMAVLRDHLFEPGRVEPGRVYQGRSAPDWDGSDWDGDDGGGNHRGGGRQRGGSDHRGHRLRGRYRAQQLRGAVRGEEWDALRDQLADLVTGPAPDPPRSSWGEKLRHHFGEQLTGQVEALLDRAGAGPESRRIHRPSDPAWFDRDPLAFRVQIRDYFWSVTSPPVRHLADLRVDRTRIREVLWPQLAEDLGAQLRGTVPAQHWDPLWHRFRELVRGPLWDRFLADEVGSVRISQKLLEGWSRPGRELDLHALRWAGLVPPPGLAEIADVERRVAWWWPMRGAVVVADRHTVLRQDRNGRPHCADGPALAWADGWELHSWNGTTVPADLVTGDGWSVRRILAEPNAELRRCAVERLGWDRFVAQAGLTPVGDEQPDPGNPGHTLRLFELPPGFRRGARLLLVRNASADRDGTRRSYGLYVRSDTTDPVAAAATTFGITAAEYAALTRAT